MNQSVHAHGTKKSQPAWAQQVVHYSEKRSPCTGDCKGGPGSVHEGLTGYETSCSYLEVNGESQRNRFNKQAAT